MDELIDLQITCPVCNGSGLVDETLSVMSFLDTISAVDQFDAECGNCVGSGWELIEVLEVVEM